MPSVDKRRIGLLLPIKTIRKLDKMGESSGLSRNEMANALLDKATSRVVLNKKDIEAIANEMRKNYEKRNKQ
jgi:hypothetical protein